MFTEKSESQRLRIVLRTLPLGVAHDLSIENNAERFLKLPSTPVARSLRLCQRKEAFDCRNHFLNSVAIETLVIEVRFDDEGANAV